MKKRKIRLIYIAGHGRSGSTLLDRTIGELNGFVSVGELGHIWERGFYSNQLCGCGKPFRKCGFWQNVVANSFGKLTEVEVGTIIDQQHRVSRTRHIPWLALKQLRSLKYKKLLQRHTQNLECLYSAIQKVSGAQFIVDSTKSPLYGFLLCNTPNIDVFVIHLVRNSNAVAYSWQRKRIRPEIINKTEYMPQFTSNTSALRWNRSNLYSLLLRKVAKKYMIVKYEDFIDRPRKMIEQVASLVEETLDSKLFLNDYYIDFSKTNHTISGNPMRFQRGKIFLRQDNEWIKKLSLKDKWVVSSLTFPFLKFFGY